MQDMIKKIVDMDEKAQEITEEAKRSKALSAQEIAETKERIRENYLARARKRIELNRIQEKNQARQILADAEKKYEVQLINAGAVPSARRQLGRRYRRPCDRRVIACFPPYLLM